MPCESILEGGVGGASAPRLKLEWRVSMALEDPAWRWVEPMRWKRCLSRVPICPVGDVGTDGTSTRLVGLCLGNEDEGE